MYRMLRSSLGSSETPCTAIVNTALSSLDSLIDIHQMTDTSRKKPWRKMMMMMTRRYTSSPATRARATHEATKPNLTEAPKERGRQREIEGWMDGWMDGRTDGWMDVWMDGWMDG